MTGPQKIARAAATVLMESAILSPVVLVMWNNAGPAMLEGALPMKWPDAFALCLLARALRARDVLPLLVRDPKPRRKRKRKTEKSL